MRSPHHGAGALRRAAVSRAARVGAAAIPALFLASCTDGAMPVTGPGSTTTAAAPTLSRAPDAATEQAFCDVATLLPGGRYRVTGKSIAMPRNAFDPNGATTIFAAHVRPDPTGDPTRLVKCVIPNTAAALARMEQVYHTSTKPSKPRMTITDLGKAPARTSQIQSTNPAARIIAVEDPGCDPTQITCVCEAGCGADDPGEEPSEGPPPTEPDIPAFSLSADAGYPAAAVTTCYGQTDRPHLSTTFGYFGRTNVHARTVCSSPLPITIGVRLERSKCFWFFCWWGTVATGFDATIGTKVEAVANESCHKGWYIGYGYHTAVWLEGPGSAQTANSAYVSC